MREGLAVAEPTSSSDERGAVMLEAAVAFPFLLLLLCTALQFYLIRHAEAAVVEAAQTAARAGSVYGLCACRRAGEAALAGSLRLAGGGAVRCQARNGEIAARATASVPVLVPLITQAGILPPGSDRAVVSRVALAGLEPDTPPCAEGW